MDLVYIPEILSFGSFRSPQYRDYEAPWNSNHFDDDRTASNYLHRQRRPQEPKTTKTTCHLCKKKKRRGIASLVRGKPREISCSEICEEEEESEESEEAEEQQQQKQQESSSASSTPDKAASKNKKSTTKA